MIKQKFLGIGLILIPTGAMFNAPQGTNCILFIAAILLGCSLLLSNNKVID